MRTIPGILIAAVAVSLVACGEPSGSPQRPTGATELVVRVEVLGGLHPPLEVERQLPEISIYGDGLVLVPAPTPDVFPGPAGGGLQAFRLSADVLDGIVTAAQAIGLRGPDRHVPQEGPEFVADGGVTVITVVAGGVRHRTTVDALFDVEADTRARQLIGDFVRRLLSLRDSADGVRDYEPSAVRIYTAGEVNAEFMAEAPLIEAAWPLDEPLAGWGQPLPADGLTVDARCGVAGGEVLATLRPVLRAATAATVVADGSTRRLLAFRPLLPDEAGC